MAEPGPTRLRPFGPLAYALVAPGLVLLQHVAVALGHRAAGEKIDADVEFWLLPVRRLLDVYHVSPLGAALTFALALALAWPLAHLSLRRASWSRMGFWIAVWTVIPGIQILAVAALALLPARNGSIVDDGRRLRAKHMLEGLLAGIAIIVLGVFVSALAFGSYGWGLFVLAPFTVGLTTGYLANRSEPIDFAETIGLVAAAGALGSLALILHALEGLACLILAAPLAALVAVMGGGLGWAMAQAVRKRRQPLLAVAFLPAVFALEAAMPPAAAIATDRSIDIDAPPAAVWRALISDEPVRPPPGLPARAGLAHPVGGRIISARAGGERVGLFSTGRARERITAWEPGHRLAFVVVEQPAAMEEMSPYRRVHAPHVQGYFETTETSFELQALPGGRTRLTARASNILRIDPILYWEPIARWAIRSNLARILEDYRSKAEGAVRRS